MKNPRTGQDARPHFLGVSSEVNSRSTDRHEPQESLPKSGRPGNTSSETAGARAASGIGEAGFTEDEDYLEALAKWLTSSNNMQFARVQANRIWYQLLGRGLVEPPDDFRATNPASHPALLDALATDFVKHKFDLRYLIRLIMNSRTYQLASEPNETNQSDEANFSHALVRRLSAEQLLDSQSQVVGVL